MLFGGQKVSSLRPAAVHRRCSTTELCRNPQRRASPWLNQLLADRIPHAASASRSYPLLQRLLGPRDGTVSAATPLNPSDCRPPLAAKPRTTPATRWSSTLGWYRSPRVVRVLGAQGATPELGPQPLSGVVIHIPPLDGTQPTLSHRVPGVRSPTCSRLPFGEAKGGLSAPTAIPLARDPKPAVRSTSTPRWYGMEGPFRGRPGLA